MAGRTRKPGAGTAAGLVPTQRPAEDLTAPSGLAALSGQRVVDIGRKTLDAAERMIGTWSDLEPLVKVLIQKFRRYAEAETADLAVATKVLTEAARVSHAVAAAATNVMRAGEGQIRLALLLAGPTPQRTHPTELTERQLVAVVLETARRIKAEQGTCPLCATTLEVATAAPATNGAAPPEG